MRRANENQTAFAFASAAPRVVAIPSEPVGNAAGVACEQPAAAELAAELPPPIRAKPEACGRCGHRAPVHGVQKIDDAVKPLCAGCTVAAVRSIAAGGGHVQPCYDWARGVA